MILYNVTVAIDIKVEEEWRAWMKEVHIPEVMETGKFVNHSFYKVMNNQEDDSASYSIQYFAESMKELQLYLAIDAQELQQKTHAAFPNKFAAFRTVLQSVD
ncbi:MAG: DUF4286 family protein [Roseivirga sp.]|nr:DUF4286 family protein [Roseivirga sp.]